MTDAATALAEFNMPDWLALNVPMPTDAYVALLVRMTCDCSPEPNRVDVIMGYSGKPGEFFTQTECTFDLLAWAPSAQPQTYFNKGKAN